MANAIEKRGVEVLVKRLRELKKKVEKSDNKTFDLRVDGEYAEVKTKSKPFSELDFISFTDKQYKQIQKLDFPIFLVSNVGGRQEEIREYRSKDLRKHEPKKYTSHEFNRSVIQNLESCQIS